MRDQKRIDRILKLIKKIWVYNSDLRLMQLLGNCFGTIDNYYQEDDLLEKRLREEYNV